MTLSAGVEQRVSPIVWSCGLGINSAALAVGIVERGLSYDLAMFSDTGGEKQKTYDYLPVLNEYLTAHNLPSVMMVWKKNADFTRAKSLEQDCLDRNALPSIAYGYKSCSDQYKIRPQNHIVDGWQPALDAWAKGERVVKYIGFDADEAHRMLTYDDKKYLVQYPLVEWNWGRDECIEAIQRAGLPVPPKSSCFFCPNMRPHEIVALTDEEKERALKIERGADLTSIKGLAPFNRQAVKIIGLWIRARIKVKMKFIV